MTVVGTNILTSGLMFPLDVVEVESPQAEVLLHPRQLIQATHSKATISMVESSTDSSISMSYSLNLSKDEYDHVLAQRSGSTSASTSTNAAVVDSAFSVGAPTADPGLTNWEDDWWRP
ncbi:uncharacterized protein LOC126409744 [Nymphaea colorata]|nr:uncharacterized protein LOC126409744 [Nymphaea colorata]